jgi:hypothetical protein
MPGFAPILLAAASLVSPQPFLSHVVRQIAANQYAAAWQTLDPADQARVPLRAYVRCESASPIPGRLVSLRILRTGSERVTVVPGKPQRSSVAVTFALRIAGAPVPRGVRVVLTAHALRHGSSWRWMLPPKRLPLYDGTCGLPDDAAWRN